MPRAFLLLSFGAPESLGDVQPFLERVLADALDEKLGENAARRETMLANAARPYEELAQLFGVASPLSQECRQILQACRELDLPLYWGNLFAFPFIEDAIFSMLEDEITQVVVMTTSPFGSTFGCQRYRRALEEILAAEKIELEINWLAPYHNHPLFLNGIAEQITRAQREIVAANKKIAAILFAAHSLPLTDVSALAYQNAVEETAAAVMKSFASANFHAAEKIAYQVVWQSRSASRAGAWLAPDFHDYFNSLCAEDFSDSEVFLVVPLGFLCENKETFYDLDVEAASLCEARGGIWQRIKTFSGIPQVSSLVKNLIAQKHFCPPSCTACEWKIALRD